MAQARKRFGQHFLHDPAIIARIVAALNPQPGETVVEIGPGRGALTRPLLERTQRLHVVEIDRDLVARLPEIAAGRDLVIHQADVLDFDFSSIAQGGRLRLVGNLPYNISTPLMFHVIDQSDAIADAVFMLQKEVAERIVAQPGTKDYGRLSVMVQWRMRVEHLFDVGPGAFQPPPKVQSSVIRMTPRAPAEILRVDRERFSRVVQSAFAQRRKTLRNSLRGVIDDAEFARRGIDPARRAETLSLEEFAALANASELER